jgi:hypothetical protein
MFLETEQQRLRLDSQSARPNSYLLAIAVVELRMVPWTPSTQGALWIRFVDWPLPTAN